MPNTCWCLVDLLPEVKETAKELRETYGAEINNLYRRRLKQRPWAIGSEEGKKTPQVKSTISLACWNERWNDFHIDEYQRRGIAVKLVIHICSNKSISRGYRGRCLRQSSARGLTNAGRGIRRPSLRIRSQLICNAHQWKDDNVPRQLQKAIHCSRRNAWQHPKNPSWKRS